MSAFLLSWSLTYLLHSTVLLGSAWLAWKLLPEEALAVKETLWRAALIGGLVTASLQVGLAVEPGLGTWRLASTPAAPAVWESPPPQAAAATALPAHESAPVAASAFVLESVSWPALAAPLREAAAPGRVPAGDRLSPPSRDTRDRATSASTAIAWERWILFAWTLGAIGLLARLGLACVALAARLADRAPIAAGGLHALLSRLQAAARMTGVALSASRRIGSPIAFGWRRREICLPEKVTHGMDVEQQELVLAHELAHHARRDPVWLIAARLVECALFFQPLNRVARLCLQQIAEYRCDDWAVERTGRPITLARCLADVAEWNLRRGALLPVPTLAVERGRLDRRVRRLLDRSYPFPAPPRPRWLVAGVALTLLLVVLTAPGVSLGHAPPPPEAAEAPTAPEAPAAPEALAAPEAPEADPVPRPAEPSPAPGAGPSPSPTPSPGPAAAPSPPPAPAVPAPPAEVRPTSPAAIAPAVWLAPRPVLAPTTAPAPPPPALSTRKLDPVVARSPSPARAPRPVVAPVPHARGVRPLGAVARAAGENGEWKIRESSAPSPSLSESPAPLADRAAVASQELAQLAALGLELEELAEVDPASAARIAELSERMARAVQPDPEARERIDRLSAELAAVSRIDPMASARLAALSRELAEHERSGREVHSEDLSDEEREERDRRRAEIERELAEHRERMGAETAAEVTRLRAELRRELEANRPDREERQEMARLREELRRELEAQRPDREDIDRMRVELRRELEGERGELFRRAEEARREAHELGREREREHRREVEELRAEIERLRAELRLERDERPQGDDGP